MNKEELKEFIDNVKKLFNKQEYQQIVDQMDEINLTDQTLELNYMFVYSLFNCHEYSSARNIIEAYLLEYLKYDQSRELAFDVLLQNQEFVFAHELVCLIHDHEQKKYLNKIESFEANFEKNNPETVKTISRNFYHLSSFDSLMTYRIFHNALKLPLKNYVKQAQFLLMDPFLSSLFKAIILDVLRKVRFDQEISFIWIDQQSYQLIPADLSKLEDNLIYVDTNDLLSAKLGNTDPTTYHQLQQELYLQLLISYPFLNKVVRNANDWIDTLIGRYYQDVSDNLDTDSLKWQKKLAKEIDQVLNN